MSLILNDFFTGLNDFKELVPDVGASVSLLDMNGSAISAKKQITDIITIGVYDSIKAITSESSKKTALMMALANLTLAKQVPHDAIKLRKSGTDVFKHEQESARRTYLENYYNAMDSLLTLLEDDENWKNTDFYARREGLQIKSASEFDALISIDQSHFFFFRTMNIQQEIIDEELSSYFDQTSEKSIEQKRLKRALAMLVISAAMQRFDPMELPSIIRNLKEDSTASRNADSEDSRLSIVASNYFKKASDIISNVDMVLNTTDTQETVSSAIEVNDPGDKHFLLG